MLKLSPRSRGPADDELSALVDQYRLAAWSLGTLTAYRSAARGFAGFLRERRSLGSPLLPATSADVAEYLALLARKGLSPNTIAKITSAIRWIHHRADLENPTAAPVVREALAGINRIHGRPRKSKKALLGRALHRILDAIDSDTTLKGRRRDPARAAELRARNRALILMGFALAARRAELVALDLEHLEVTPTGYKITIARSKTDKKGHGQVVAVDHVNVDTSPLAALEDWLRFRGPAPGPVFLRLDNRTSSSVDAYARRLTPQTVRAVVQTAALAAGLNPNDYSAHSLRKALATAAAAAGAPLQQIARAGRWRSLDALKLYLLEPDEAVTRYLLSALVH